MDYEMIGIVICATLVPILFILYLIGVKVDKKMANVKMRARRKWTDNRTIIVEIRKTDISELFNSEMFDSENWGVIQEAPIEKIVFKRMDAVDDSVE